MKFSISHATSSEDLTQVRQLFLNYAAETKLDLCFQKFDEELSGLPGKYGPPSGHLLLARDGTQPSGCVALRDLSGGICEMKRLYVQPEFRGHGVGKQLVFEILRKARATGYRAIRLDTLATMRPALGVYESFGFRRIAPYYPNPLPDVVYLELIFHLQSLQM